MYYRSEVKTIIENLSKSSKTVKNYFTVNCIYDNQFRVLAYLPEENNLLLWNNKEAGRK